MDVTEAAGIDFVHENGAFGEKYLPETMGSGVAFFDADGDGDQDLLFVNSRRWPGHRIEPEPTAALYLNRGDGSFEDRTAGSGLDVPLYGMGVAISDYDADGDQDIYLTVLGPNRLLENSGSGVFREAPHAASVADPGFSSVATWLDADGDGDLDLFLLNYVEWSIEEDIFCALDGVNKSYCTPESYNGASAVLYRNDGAAGFTDVTREAGLFNPRGKGLGVAVLDFDDDGLFDLAVANDTQPNYLYRNLGGGRFEDAGVLSGIAFAENGAARGAMGIDASDYDGDGMPDLVIGNFSNEMVSLYHNEGVGFFIDQAPVSEIGRNSLLTLAFGAFFFDYDLDGRQDIFVANGHVENDIAAVQQRVSYRQAPHLFRNRGDGGFEEVTTASPDLVRPMVARGAAFGDIDGDGDPDLAVSGNGGPARLFRNDGGERNGWVGFRLRGGNSNRDGIGAKIILAIEDAGMTRSETRVVKSATGYASQNQLEVVFGLGSGGQRGVRRSALAFGKQERDRGPRGPPDPPRRGTDLVRFVLACAGAAALAALGLFVTSAGAPPVAAAAVQAAQPIPPTPGNAGLQTGTAEAAAAHAAQPVPPPLSEQPAMMVGSAECLTCHEQAHDDWTSSRHSKMVQPAVPGQVLGDFTQEVLRLRGEEYRIRRTGSRYFITEPFFTGEPVEHRVDYTLGNRRIQHYLTTLEDGRVIVLPPTWDVLRREWFHNLEIAAPDQAEGIVPVQLWNKNCFGCHVSDQIKGFRPGEDRYDTTWLDFGTTCERCHGPGSRHVDKYMNLDFYGDDPASYIVQQTRLDHETNSMVCAQCHSFRDQMAFGFAAGDNYFDHFFPILEYTQEPSEDPTWYPDGKTRRFSTNTLGIWQSECFVEGGATCTGCHIDPHRPDIERNEQLLPTNNGLCTGCHEAIGADLTAHTFHPAQSEGSSCVECHMPRSVTSIRAKMRDHSISIPSPRNTARYGVPNACNECHTAESPEWATERMDEWWGETPRRRKIERRADAYAGARELSREALDLLLAMSADEDEGPINRANAAGHLGRYLADPATREPATRALLAASEDAHPPGAGRRVAEAGRDREHRVRRDPGHPGGPRPGRAPFRADERGHLAPQPRHPHPSGRSRAELRTGEAPPRDPGQLLRRRRAPAAQPRPVARPRRQLRRGGQGVRTELQPGLQPARHPLLHGRDPPLAAADPGGAGPAALRPRGRPLRPGSAEPAPPARTLSVAPFPRGMKCGPGR